MSDPASSDPEGNRFTGRLGRYARVGRAVTGIAARAAGQRVLGREQDNDRNAAELRAALGGLKGPLMKVAQILSTIPDALPKEYARELSQLQANAPTMGWPFVKRRMRTELGADWESKFADFSHEAVAAASIGQVHRATLLDGRDVACKLQYPDMTSAVEADLRQLDLILGIHKRMDGAIDTALVRAEIGDRLREEVDYDREARNLSLYRTMLADADDVRVPETIPALSTKRLITMTWLDGVPMVDMQEADQDTRNKVAMTMFRAWYIPFYHYGVIHGDPHLGNYKVGADASIALLDFGSIRVFRPAFVGGVIELYHALRDNDRDRAVHAYETWGFENLSDELLETLSTWASFVYAPLMEDRARPMEETNSGVYGREVAEKVHTRLRQIGGVRPPREFVLMDRAALGLGSVFLRLRANVNWYRVFHDLIEDFDLAKLTALQTKILGEAGIQLDG